MDFSSLINDLKRSSQPIAAQQLGALCKAGFRLCSESGLHGYVRKDLGNCIISYCRAITFAFMTFVELMDLQCLENANEVGLLFLGCTLC